CHGNAGNLSSRGDSVLLWQRELPTAVLLFDYPGFGRSTGSPSEAGCYAAGDAAYDWLTRTKGVPAERGLLFGKSLGGAIASALAVRKSHRALVLAMAFTSFPDMAQVKYPWLPGRWLVRNQMNNLAKLGKVKRPVFISHGTVDGVVPFSMGEQLYAA